MQWFFSVSTADSKDINSEAKTRNIISSEEPSEQDTHENSVRKDKVGYSLDIFT